MLAFLEGPDLIIVLVIVALLFGGTQLPKLAKSLGQAKTEFERGIKEGSAGSTDAATPAASDKKAEADKADADKPKATTPSEAPAAETPPTPES
jgi:sec-independent protein translocase protein TatA